MIAINEYFAYWKAMAKRIQGLGSAMMVAIDQGMADKIKSIPEEQSPVLFFLPPTMELRGDSVDSLRTITKGVVFVMGKFNQRTSSSEECLAKTQLVAADVLNTLIRDSALACSNFKADLNSLDMMPETSFFAGWAGWSIGFSLSGV